VVARSPVCDKRLRRLKVSLQHLAAKKKSTLGPFFVRDPVAFLTRLLNVSNRALYCASVVRKCNNSNDVNSTPDLTLVSPVRVSRQSGTGGTSRRYPRAFSLSHLQVFSTDSSAAIFGPAVSLPIWILFCAPTGPRASRCPLYC
jgi:hypothetical protein